MARAILKHDLYFHSAHGLCRVEAVNEQDHSCRLQPLTENKSKVSFVVPIAGLESAGFSQVISVRMANTILKYLETGVKKGPGISPAWQLAELIRFEAFTKDPVKGTRRRQDLDKAILGLGGELAFVLKISLRDAMTTIQTQLEKVTSVNSQVLNAFTRASGG